MDSNHLGPAQGGESEVDAGDWRSQLQPDSRHQIVNRIMETLKRLLPVSDPEGLRKIAVRFEEKIYTAATSESDYLRKITVKMLTMEPNSKKTTALPPMSAPTINCRIRSTRFTSPPPNSGFHSALNHDFFSWGCFGTFEWIRIIGGLLKVENPESMPGIGGLNCSRILGIKVSTKFRVPQENICEDAYYGTQL
ncbi:mediator of RNA polymerase II transcription subunit 15a-like isoform X2 [Cucurbita maxima]|uniref:Mediator of RNA polymerase II transcription subunit 15a-like isoform X2 n=1 Tax=Cucurbita maxima TaxID=3661 RepID=A0A6J1JNS4_CUCMA|nr:mediator of RNA polymerase II transcription subunit 15a-like isoform X2 [Cucurbita maxima]